MVTGYKCRKLSTFVERSVEGPDTFSRNRCPIKRSSNAFNQLPRLRLESVVGKRSASNQSVPRITECAKTRDGMAMLKVMTKNGGQHGWCRHLQSPSRRRQPSIIFTFTPTSRTERLRMPLCGILRGGGRPAAVVAIRHCSEHTQTPRRHHPEAGRLVVRFRSQLILLSQCRAGFVVGARSPIRQGILRPCVTCGRIRARP
jgi:hypothetical protein